VRLARARSLRKVRNAAEVKCWDDNFLRGNALFSVCLRRAARANMIGISYWIRGKEKLGELFISQKWDRYGAQPVSQTDKRGFGWLPATCEDPSMVLLGSELDFLATLLPESEMNRVLDKYVLGNREQQRAYC
jgi:hypothetical protein